MLSQSSLVGAQVSSLKSRIPSQLSSKAVGAVFPRAREDHLPFPRVVVAVLAAATGVDDPVSVEVPGLEDAAHVVLAGVAGAGVLVVAEEAHPDVAPALVRGVRVRVADLEAVAGLPVGAQVVLRLPEAPVELLEADVVGAVELVDAGKLVRPRGDAAAASQRSTPSQKQPLSQSRSLEQSVASKSGSQVSAIRGRSWLASGTAGIGIKGGENVESSAHPTATRAAKKNTSASSQWTATTSP